MDIINLLTITLLPIGILVGLYVIWTERYWSTVWSKSKFDGLAYKHCTFEIQKNSKTNKYRLIHNGEFVDPELKALANEELNKLNK